jgi:DNA mismatch repair protein MutS
MKKTCSSIVFYALIFTTILPSIPDAQTTEQEQPLPNSIIKKIGDLNLQTFEYQHYSWSTNSYIEYVQRALRDILNPLPQHKRKTAFHIFELLEKQHNEIPLNINTNIWIDLNLFCGKTNKKKYVANAIDRTYTELGKVSLYQLLAQPTTNITLLQQRQQIIKTFQENDALLKDISDCLTYFQQGENVLIHFWDKDHFKQNADRELFFTFPLFKSLNKDNDALFIKSISDHTMRIWTTGITIIAAAALLSYGSIALADQSMPKKIDTLANKYHGCAGVLSSFLWNIKNDHRLQALIAFFAGATCAYNAWKNVDWIRGSVLFENAIQTLMINIAKTQLSMHALHKIIQENPTLAACTEFTALKDLFDTSKEANKELSAFFALLEKNTFKGTASLFSNKGFVLHAYNLMHSLNHKLEAALASTARIDAYVSLARLMQEHKGKRVSFCFAQYIQAPQPSIALTNGWHPLIDTETVIPNSIYLGTHNERPHAIITGPNEGGKSTILKTITLCLLMAQTCGIAPAQALTITPFNTIATYLNITDDIGTGNSLFKAEVLRAQELIDNIKNAKPGEFSFVVFDEVFNATSPAEGSAAAYSVAKHISQYSNSCCIIATHFELLTKLEKETSTFCNYRVTVTPQEDGSINYPHTIEKGISQQHIALDILQQQGFASSIVQEARSIVTSNTNYTL